MVDKTSPPHLFADVLARVHAVCGALAAEGRWPGGVDLSRVVVEPPRDASHGDMATNAAMVLAKEAKAKPRDLAEAIAAKLRNDDLIAAVDVAGPGFINLTLQPKAWSDALRTVLREGDGYGRSAMGAAEKVNVEYVSANPTGPMHVGHCRGAVFCDAHNIKHDVFSAEGSLMEGGNTRAAETVDYLRAKGDVYEGRLPPQKGAPVEDYEDREQTLFRATAYGDDVDRPLLKSDGSYTYFGSDIAYHKSKFDRGFHNLVDVWGADHRGYIKRTQAAVKTGAARNATLQAMISLLCIP